MTDWDSRFLDLAAHVAAWSKDPSTRVGAVIARLAFGIEEGEEIECLDIMDDRVIARLKYDDNET